LVRVLCRHCREPYEPVAEFLEKMQLQDLASGKTLYRAVGCEHCGRTGFHGRSSVVEVLPLGDDIRRVLLKSGDAVALQQAAVARGMQTMRMHGIRKALAGETTIEEVLRATRAV